VQKLKPDPGYNVMVRVGGGWQSLEKYLETHKSARGRRNKDVHMVLRSRVVKPLRSDVKI
jgi:hypothetical protein